MSPGGGGHGTASSFELFRLASTKLRTVFPAYIALDCALSPGSAMSQIPAF